jgi:undecaprenyl diphosphate synthase
MPTKPRYTNDELLSFGLDPDKLPRHVAIIMDGNGRWAGARDEVRTVGHRQGAGSVRLVVEECCRLGLDQLTLYCLSSENWKRPQTEVDFLMALLKEFLIDERTEILEQNIRFTTIGRRDPLPDDVLAEIDTNVELSKNNQGMTLCLAINYGSRMEITDAVQQIASQVASQQLQPTDITEETINNALYTRGQPDPDLVVRTAGEMRISNFLLWQISYSEIYVTETFWPDFDRISLFQALRSYGRRERRYGGLIDMAPQK